MRHRSKLAAALALHALGCGGISTGVPVAASDGGSNGEESSGGSSASAPAGSAAGLGPFIPGFGPSVQVGPGTVACGTAICNAMTGVCCVQVVAPLGPGALSCTPPGGCPNGGALSCSSAASCPGSEVCCFSAGALSADPVAGGSATCEKACSAGQTQLCTTSAECPSGQTCQETSSSLPQVCRDAPENAFRGCALSPTTTGGTSGVGECTVSLSATCGSATYEATCACPEGTCACFGSSTRIVKFAGCPFCPSDNSVGPTTTERIFDLCGFSPP